MQTDFPILTEALALAQETEFSRPLEAINSPSHSYILLLRMWRLTEGARREAKLEGVMLSDISQREQDKYWKISLIYGV